MADGKKNAILSSGFDVRKQSEKNPPVSKPVGLNVKREEKQGQVGLSWKTVRGAQSYIIEMTTTDPALPETEWVKTAFTARVSHVVKHLTQGTYYWFRVRAVGRNR